MLSVSKTGGGQRMDDELLITFKTIMFCNVFGRHPILNNDNWVQGLSELICQSFGAIFEGNLLSAVVKCAASGDRTKALLLLSNSIKRVD